MVVPFFKSWHTSWATRGKDLFQYSAKQLMCFAEDRVALPWHVRASNGRFADSQFSSPPFMPPFQVRLTQQKKKDENETKNNSQVTKGSFATKY